MAFLRLGISEEAKQVRPGGSVALFAPLIRAVLVLWFPPTLEAGTGIHRPRTPTSLKPPESTSARLGSGGA